MADEEKTTPTNNTGTEKENSIIYYIIGLLALLVVVGAGLLLRPKIQTTTPQTAVTTIVDSPTPTPGLITKFACERQYYNPVIGKPEYYLSVEGVDVDPATDVTCEFTVSVGSKVTEEASVSSQLTEAPGRDGSTFRCTTAALKLSTKVPIKVDVRVTDDQEKAITCSRTFVLP